MIVNLKLWDAIMVLITSDEGILERLQTALVFTRQITPDQLPPDLYARIERINQAVLVPSNAAIGQGQEYASEIFCIYCELAARTAPC